MTTHTSVGFVILNGVASLLFGLHRLDKGKGKWSSTNCGAILHKGCTDNTHHIGCIEGKQRGRPGCAKSGQFESVQNRTEFLILNLLLSS